MNTETIYGNTNSNSLEAFLATVTKVYADDQSFSDKKIDSDNDNIKIYNGNSNFSEKDIRFLGAVEFTREKTINLFGYAYPMDKNLMTFPIVGETILILSINNWFYYLPYSNTLYPNYRESWAVSEITKGRESTASPTKKENYKETKETGTVNQIPNQQKSQEKQYEVKESVHFLKPRQGDTMITGRAGQTIRFSEFFLTEDGKTSSPSMFIRNLENPELSNEKIGTLVDENINKDGSSIYIVSNKVKVPYKEVVKKQKIAFENFPSSEKLKGNQIYINSDRIVISSKSEEVIIFGAKNTGIITDGRFSVDAKNGAYIHSESNDITFHTINGKNIFLNSDSSGKIFLGKNKGVGDAGADVQKMVLGGELVSILSELVDAITQQVFLTPSGPTAVGPNNAPKFNSIKNKLKTILSARNYLSKQ